MSPPSPPESSPVGGVVLGVTGSIAAYKACELASRLVQAGHAVDVIMTRAAGRFVRPLTFGALTHRRVLTDQTWGTDEPPQDHLAVVAGAGVFVIAPCTANVIGKLSHGIADDVLSATWLAARCPRILCPAMNARMWEHPRVQANAATLRAEGVRFVGPERGWLSEHEVGIGRLADPADILRAVEEVLRGPASPTPHGTPPPPRG